MPKTHLRESVISKTIFGVISWDLGYIPVEGRAIWVEDGRGG